MQLETTNEALTRGRQDLHMQRLGTAPGYGKGTRQFRTTIKRDSYDSQSYAKVEIWTTNGWTEVVTLRGDHPVMSELPSYAVPEEQRQDAWDALRSVALMLETQAEEVTR